MTLSSLSPELFCCSSSPDICRPRIWWVSFEPPNSSSLFETHPWQEVDLLTGWSYGIKESPIGHCQRKPSAQENDESDIIKANARRTSQFLASSASVKHTKHTTFPHYSTAARELHITLSDRADGWVIIRSFTNLSALCVNAPLDWIRLYYTDLISQEETRKISEAAAATEIRPTAPTFPQLRELTLREHVPAEWVAMFLSGADSLTDLDHAFSHLPLTLLWLLIETSPVVHFSSENLQFHCPCDLKERIGRA